MKKETLEEAAEIYSKTFIEDDGTTEVDFISGAKWQQERIPNEINQKWDEYRNATNNEDAWLFKEWLIEQFKRK
jgi:hypothetical protein